LFKKTDIKIFSISHDIQYRQRLEITSGYSTLRDPEDGGNIKLWNVSNSSPSNTESRPTWILITHPPRVVTCLPDSTLHKFCRWKKKKHCVPC